MDPKNEDKFKTLIRKRNSWIFTYIAYSKWKIEAPWRRLCSTKELEDYDVNLSQRSIYLMKNLNNRMCYMWNTAGGLLAFNPKDFHIMVTEHFWASCYKNLFFALSSFEESLREKIETIYVCPNIFDIQSTSDKVLICLLNSWKHLCELESLLVLHLKGCDYYSRNQDLSIRQINSNIIGIDKIKPESWTSSHAIVYFQICNCYMINNIKAILDRMANLSFSLRAIDSIEFDMELSKCDILKFSSEGNEIDKILRKPQRLQKFKRVLDTISEELPLLTIHTPYSNSVKIIWKSKSDCPTSKRSCSPLNIDYSKGDMSQVSYNPVFSPSPVTKKCIEPLDDSKMTVESRECKLGTKVSGCMNEMKESKRKIFPLMMMHFPSKSKLLKMSRKPLSFIMQKLRKNVKNFDTISVSELTSKGLI